MVDASTAKKALVAARKEAHKHGPGHLFRVPGFPGIFSDGRNWVVDVNERGQDWYFHDDGLVMEKRSWPE